MRKSIKKLLGVALTAAMCFSLLPVQTVKAEEDGANPLTEEQVKDILFGTWKLNDGREITFGEQIEYKYSHEGLGDINIDCSYYKASYDDNDERFSATYTTDIEKHAEGCYSDYSNIPHTDVYVSGYCPPTDDGVFEATVYCYERYEMEDYRAGEYTLEYKILENGETATLLELIKQAVANAYKEEVAEETDTETEEDAQYSLTEEQLKNILFGTWKTDDGEEITFGEQVEYESVVPWEEGTKNYNCSYYEASFEYYSEEPFSATYTTDIEKHIEGCWSDDTNIPHADIYIDGYFTPTDESTFEVAVQIYEHFEMEDIWVNGFGLEYKVLENGKTATMEQLIQQALAGTSKEEVKEDVKEEPKTEKASGRTLQEGESVYIVKKGDCLWGIARTLLGDGRKYTELYTRNNDIVEKATLIFPGQEIIIPAK